MCKCNRCYEKPQCCLNSAYLILEQSLKNKTRPMNCYRMLTYGSALKSSVILSDMWRI